MKKETIEQKAQKHKKDFAYTICMHNSRIRKSGAQIAYESFFSGYHQCEKDCQKETAVLIIKELLNIISYLNEDDPFPEDFEMVHKAEKYLSEVK
jgi:hypothetical protein